MLPDCFELSAKANRGVMFTSEIMIVSMELAFAICTGVCLKKVLKIINDEPDLRNDAGVVCSHILVLCASVCAPIGELMQEVLIYEAIKATNPNQRRINILTLIRIFFYLS